MLAHSGDSNSLGRSRMVRRERPLLRVACGVLNRGNTPDPRIRQLLYVLCLDNVERKSMLQLHAGCAENGSEGARRPTLLANEFADISRVNLQKQDGMSLLRRDHDRNLIRVVHEGTANCRDQIGDGFCCLWDFVRYWIHHTTPATQHVG